MPRDRWMTDRQTNIATKFTLKLKGENNIKMTTDYEKDQMIITYSVSCKVDHTHSPVYITECHHMPMALWVFIICLTHSMQKSIDHLLSDILVKYQTDSFFLLHKICWYAFWLGMVCQLRVSIIYIVYCTNYPYCFICWLAALLPGLILGLHPTNERHRYNVTLFLIGWVQA